MEVANGFTDRRILIYNILPNKSIVDTIINILLELLDITFKV